MLSPVFNYSDHLQPHFMPSTQYISADMCHHEVCIVCLVLSKLSLQINCEAHNFKMYKNVTITSRNEVQGKNIKEWMSIIIHF